MGSHGHEVTRYACMHCHAVYCTCKRYTEVGCVQSVMKASFINYLKCMVNFSVTYHDCMNLSLRVSLDKRDKIKICNMLNALNEEWLWALELVGSERAHTPDVLQFPCRCLWNLQQLSIPVGLSVLFICLCQIKHHFLVPMARVCAQCLYNARLLFLNLFDVDAAKCVSFWSCPISTII